MKFLKTSLLLISAFIIASGFAPAKKKFAYTSDEGKFMVTFPEEFNVERDEGRDVTTIKISCMLDNQTYFASYSIHKTELMDHEEMAQVSYDSFLDAVQGVPRSKTDWKVNGKKGIKAVMDMQENSVKLEYRVVLVDNIQYQLVVLAANNDYDEKMAGDFFESFKMK